MALCNVLSLLTLNVFDRYSVIVYVPDTWFWCAVVEWVRIEHVIGLVSFSVNATSMIVLL